MKSPLETQEDLHGIKHDLTYVDQEDDVKSERYSALMLSQVVKGFNRTFLGIPNKISKIRESPSQLSNITLP